MINNKLKKDKSITWRDLAWLFLGIFGGMVIMYLIFYGFAGNILTHLRIEQVTIGFNESKLVELAYEKAIQGAIP